MATPLIGEIILVAFNFAPTGWAQCNGQLLPIAQNDTLFTLIGTTYGGDGIDTFALPDLRSRVPIHFGQGSGLLPYTLAETTGSEQVTLLVTQIPPHNHPVDPTTLVPSLACQTNAGNQRSPVGNVPALEAAGVTRPYSSSPPNADMRGGTLSVTGTATSANAGGTQPHNNLQPILAMNFCIALQGIFPTQ